MFGMGIHVSQTDGDWSLTRVKVCTSPTFYAWVFQWGGKVRIDRPREVLVEFQEMVQTSILSP